MLFRKLNAPQQLPGKHITHVRMCKYGGYILISVFSVTVTCIWCMYNYNSNWVIISACIDTNRIIISTPVLLHCHRDINTILTTDYCLLSIAYSLHLKPSHPADPKLLENIDKYTNLFIQSNSK